VNTLNVILTFRGVSEVREMDLFNYSDSDTDMKSIAVNQFITFAVRKIH